MSYHLSPRTRHILGNGIAILFGLAMVVVMLLALEGALRAKAFLLQKKNITRITVTNEGPTHAGGILGYSFQPDSRYRTVVTKGTEILFDKTYQIDTAGHRKTVCKQDTPKADMALFFGCSFTFGTGVEDEETLPSRFCARSPRYNALNYGLPAAGPQQTWLQIVHQRGMKPYVDRRGIVIFTYIDDHIKRLIGSPEIIDCWPFSLPWMTIEEGKIRYKGTFLDRSKAFNPFYSITHHSHLMRFIERRVPQWKEPILSYSEGIRLFAVMMRECMEAVQKDAPGFRFHVVLFPMECNDYKEELVRQLTQEQVNFLDYNELLDKETMSIDERFYQDGPNGAFGHPKAVVYDQVATALSERLQ